MGFQKPIADGLPRHPVIIGGVEEQAGGGDLLAHIYPGTGTVTAELRMASPADVDRAVAAARAAFPAWRALSGDKRRDLMFRLAASMEAESQNLAPILTAENGSGIVMSGYMGYDAAQKFRYFGGWADKIEGTHHRHLGWACA